MTFFESAEVERELVRGVDSVTRFRELGALQWGNSKTPRPGALKRLIRKCHDVHEVFCQTKLPGKAIGQFGALRIPFFGNPLSNLQVVRLWDAMVEVNPLDSRFTDAFLQPGINWLTSGGLNMHVFFQHLYKEFWFRNSPRSIVKLPAGVPSSTLSLETIVAESEKIDTYCIDKSLVFGQMNCRHIADFAQYLNDLFLEYEWNLSETLFDDEGRRVGMPILGSNARGMFVTTTADNLLRRGYMDSIIPRVAGRLNGAAFDPASANNTKDRLDAFKELTEASLDESVGAFLPAPGVAFLRRVVV